MRPASILIVDDEVLSREVMAAHLSDLGYKVVTAQDAAGAMRVLGRSDRFAMAILDERMPGMSGADLLGMIERCHPGLPVIAMASHWVEARAWEQVAYPWMVGMLPRSSRLAEVEQMVRGGLDSSPAVGGWHT